MRFSTTYGGDRTRMAPDKRAGWAPAGLVAPRNAFVGEPLPRVDRRFLKRVTLGGSRQLDGIVEVFNLFNHKNFGSYATNLSIARTYGRPNPNNNVAYAPRMMQLGFRFTF